MSDHFTKWVEAVPMADQKAETVARAFIDNVVSRHGVPVKLLTLKSKTSPTFYIVFIGIIYINTVLIKPLINNE
jgi:hypothetical protein